MNQQILKRIIACLLLGALVLGLLPMFAMAGTTICLGDGVESVKAAADYVTDPVLGDGVFNALRHYGLI